MIDLKVPRKLPLRKRVLELLSSKDDTGGPQSVADVCRNLDISNTNSRSVLVRLHKKGAIERIEKGVYRIKGDKRTYKNNPSNSSE